MISVPLWIVVLVAVAIAFGIWTVHTSKGDGEYGTCGCSVALLGVVAVLAVLLVHAWGWM